MPIAFNGINFFRVPFSWFPFTTPALLGILCNYVLISLILYSCVVLSMKSNWTRVLCKRFGPSSQKSSRFKFKCQEMQINANIQKKHLARSQVSPQSNYRILHSTKFRVTDILANGVLIMVGLSLSDHIIITINCMCVLRLDVN